MQKRTVRFEAPNRFARFGVQCIQTSAVGCYENFASVDNGFNARADPFVDEVADPSEAERRANLGVNETGALKVAPQSRPIPKFGLGDARNGH